MKLELSDEILSRLGDFATATVGLRFPPDRWRELSRGVAAAALELGISDVDAWIGTLLADKASGADIKALANHLTIGETYFFRHRESFTLLGEQILPQRFALRRQQGKPLRIWSAACSTGEEPYSVAMLLRRMYPELSTATVSILATDINSHSLARAQRGLYSEWSFRDTPSWVKEAYFSRKPNGRYEISPEVRQLVKFSHLNFADPFYPAEFGERADYDLILCRNVLMYFSAEWHARIVRRLVAALAPEGWLLVGPCDISVPQATELGLDQRGPGVFLRTDAKAVARPVASALPPMLWPTNQTAQPMREESTPQVALWMPAPEPVPAPTATTAPLPEATQTESEVVSALAHEKAGRGDLSAALLACDEAIALDKVNPAFHYLRGCILQEQERLPEAVQAFQRVLFLDQQAVMAHFALGCIAERLGDRAEARRHLALVLRLLGEANRGDAVPGAEGLTVGRLRAVVEHTLRHDAA